MAKPEDNREKLIAILQLAYSGERAAAYAYRGHWQSVTDSEECDAIRRIEEDEWRHRTLVGEILTELGSGPKPRREVRATIIGRTLGFLCHLTGWLAPMYGAGKLESRNVREYETAARYARDCGRLDLIDCLLEMAEVEWDHEHYFRSCVLKHRLGRRLPLWPAPPPKETIRLSYEEESTQRTFAANSRPAVETATPAI
ncbi:MAG TPA: ferritin-like domain-containing protein [Pyrinomonadaceae bacterium]|nr:ferritin-like domain-containing protein [Pyrinomonadaceae bacterium]